MLVRVLWAGRYGRGAVDRSDALAAEVLVRALLARVLLCVAQMAQEDAGGADGAGGRRWRRWRRRTQVTQVMQTGDAAKNNRRQAAENNDSGYGTGTAAGSNQSCTRRRSCTRGKVGRVPSLAQCMVAADSQTSLRMAESRHDSTAARGTSVCRTFTIAHVNAALLRKELDVDRFV